MPPPPDTAPASSSSTPAPTLPIPAQTTTTPAETAAMLNRVSVALARSQRLMDSWLPASASTSDASPTYDPAETPLTERPERLGVGATLPADGFVYPSRGTGLAGLSKTLGLKMPPKKGAMVARKGDGAGEARGPRTKGDWGEGGEVGGVGGSKADGEGGESAEEDEGRTSVVGKGSAKKTNGTGKDGEQGDDGESKAGEKKQRKKRGASYLDEMLGARKKKKGKMARGDED